MGATNGLLDEGKASLGSRTGRRLGRHGRRRPTRRCRRSWDTASTELNAALQNLGHTISEAGQNMGQTEAGVTSFVL